MNIYISDDIRYLNNLIDIKSKIINGDKIVIIAPFFSYYLIDYSLIKNLSISFEKQIIYIGPGYLTKFVSLKENNLSIETYSYGPKNTSEIISWISDYYKIESKDSNIIIHKCYNKIFKNFDYQQLDNHFDKNLTLQKNTFKHDNKEIIFTDFKSVQDFSKHSLKEYLENGNFLIIIYDFFDISAQEYNNFVNDTINYLKNIIINEEQILLFRNGMVGRNLNEYYLNFGWNNADLNSFIYSTITFLKTKGYKFKKIYNYCNNSNKSLKKKISN